MEEKFSKEYKCICRFFKEIGLYKEFLTYQREANEHVNFHCETVPCNTHKPYEALGHSAITSWIEKVKNVQFRYKLYDVFKVWVKEVKPNGIKPYTFIPNDMDYLIITPLKKIRVKELYFKS